MTRKKKEEVIDKFQRSKQEEPVKGTNVYLCVDETTFELVKQLNENGAPHLAVAVLIRGNKYYKRFTCPQYPSRKRTPYCSIVSTNRRIRPKYTKEISLNLCHSDCMSLVTPFTDETIHSNVVYCLANKLK